MLEDLCKITKIRSREPTADYYKAKGAKCYKFFTLCANLKVIVYGIIFNQ